MTTIGLLVDNKKEGQLLSKAFQQQQYDTRIIELESPPNHFNVMKIKPDILLVEIPQNPIQYITTIQRVHGNRLLSHIPIIAYGAFTDNGTIKKLTNIGVLKYFMRPLKIAVLLNIFEVVMNAKAKALAKENETVEDIKNQDLSLLLDPKVLGGKKISIMVSYTENLLAFPFSVAKIVELTGSDQSNADDLANVIKSDPGISANIVKAANSISFGGRSQVSDFKESIVRIGFKETKKIALGLKVINLHGKVSKHPEFDRENYWFHSICCALVAEKIAKQMNFENPSLAFLAGLLHEYYILLMDEYFPEVFMKIIFKTQVKLMGTNEACKSVTGILPGEFIVELARKWGLPREIITALRYHKDFLDLSADINSPLEKQLITIVGLADVLTKTARIGQSCDEYIQPIPPQLFVDIGMNAGVPPQFFDSILGQIDMFTALLGLKRRGFPELCFVSSTMQNVHAYIIQNKKMLFEPHLYFLQNSDVEWTVVNSATTLERRLSEEDGEDEQPILIFNQTDDDDATPFSEFDEFINNNSICKVFFQEPNKKLVVPSNCNSKTLSKSLDLRSIIQAFDSLLTDLLDVTR